jgi:hypothetical protein
MGNAASTLTTVGGDLGSNTAGQLLAGDLVVYVDNSGGDFTVEQLARIDDAIAALNAVINPFGVHIIEVGAGDRAEATTILRIADVSACGGAGEGVLGCEEAGAITLIKGWNWYAGAAATAVGAAQYDFETIAMHELGHALGLGHSVDSHSVMFATLATGVARRDLSASDLAIPDLDTGPCGLHVQGWVGCSTTAESGGKGLLDAGAAALPAAASSSGAALLALGWNSSVGLDHVTCAGGSADVLVGGRGDDLIVGNGAGRDVLVGGMAATPAAGEQLEGAVLLATAQDPEGEFAGACDAVGEVIF